MKKRRIILLLLLFCLLVFISPTPASADMGPKDKLTVYVENPPTEEYYLDLLTQDINKYNNIKDDVRKGLNEHMISLLYNYEADGWKPALTEGTKMPMRGNLIGEPYDNGFIHTFGYHGVPDTYRIIIVTENGKVSVSDIYTRKALQSSVTYDYATGQVKIPSTSVSYLVQFLTTCIPTLIIEGIILILFKFKFKENYKVFLVVNILTQIALTIILGTTLIKYGSLAAYFIQFPTELIILIVESSLFYKFLKGKSPKQNIIYGFVANLSSWTMGYFLISYQYNLLVSYM